MKCSMMLHFIWVFTVCKNNCLGVSRIQWVNLFIWMEIQTLFTKSLMNELTTFLNYSKTDKSMVLMANGSLMKIESIAESAILFTCTK